MTRTVVLLLFAAILSMGATTTIECTGFPGIIIRGDVRGDPFCCGGVIVVDDDDHDDWWDDLWDDLEDIFD